MATKGYQSDDRSTFTTGKEGDFVRAMAQSRVARRKEGHWASPAWRRAKFVFLWWEDRNSKSVCDRRRIRRRENPTNVVCIRDEEWASRRREERERNEHAGDSGNLGGAVRAEWWCWWALCTGEWAQRCRRSAGSGLGVGVWPGTLERWEGGRPAVLEGVTKAACFYWCWEGAAV